MDYRVWIQPRNFLGRLAVPVQVGLLCRAYFRKVFRRYDEGIQSCRRRAGSPGPVSRVPVVVLEKFRIMLKESGALPEAVEKLLELVAVSEEEPLLSLRPYAFADSWGFERHEVLKVFLLATRAGLLDLQWKVLCPSCRGSDKPLASLSQVSSRAHCDSCQIDFEVNFDRFTELVFRPNSAVRALHAREYCIGGPQVTPHIRIQQLMAPGETRQLISHLEPGRYRSRVLGLRSGIPVLVSEKGPASVEVSVPEGEWPDREIEAGPDARWTVTNPGNAERLFIVERAAWSDQAVTAAEVTGLQIFRDLFSSEALRPGEQISVGKLALVFTDLKDSTRFYHEVGDAPAFGCVMQHFDILKEVIARHGGGIVKTIGDAVMAVFPDSFHALEAMGEAQQQLASACTEHRPMILKAGIHEGTCIAVTLNDRLDYFGSTANIASRLCSLSTGKDIVVSGASYETVSSSDPSGRWQSEPFDAVIKGYEEETFHLHRIKPSGQPAKIG